MRLHTSTINADDLGEAARLARVTFDQMDKRGSKSQRDAWDVKLFGNSGRRPNFGHSGAGSYGVGSGEAATWDEWGIFLAALYRVDPLMKTPYYLDAEDFHWQTARRFVTLEWPDQHRIHKWGLGHQHPSGYFSERECVGSKGPSNPGCGAVSRWMLHGHKFTDLPESYRSMV